MLNTRRGKRFETVLKRKLKTKGFKVLKLAIPETADLILLNQKPLLIECKVCNQSLWYRKNLKQYDRLLEMFNEGYDVYIVIKFTGHDSIIKFFKIGDTYPFKYNEGKTLDEFIEGAKK
jgi:Holliday junction resolvase